MKNQNKTEKTTKCYTPRIIVECPCGLVVKCKCTSLLPNYNNIVTLLLFETTNLYCVKVNGTVIIIIIIVCVFSSH